LTQKNFFLKKQKNQNCKQKKKKQKKKYFFMTDTKVATEAPPPPPVSVPTVASEPPKKPKRDNTPKQLEQLKRARQKKSQLAAERKASRKHAITRSTKSSKDSAEDLVRRIERADPETHTRSSSRSRSPKRRRGASPSGGFKFGSTKDFALGAVFLGGMALAAYEAKKKIGNSSSVPASESSAQQIKH
jgi:hypothetical protein